MAPQRGDSCWRVTVHVDGHPKRPIVVAMTGAAAAQRAHAMFGGLVGKVERLHGVATHGPWVGHGNRRSA